MSEEAAPAAAAPAPAAKKSGPTAIATIGIVAAALLGGLAAGMFLVGPRLAPKPHDAHAAAAEEEAEEDGGHGGKGAHGGKEAAGRPVYRLDNLIVNPAGSQGSRFLLATVALEVSSEKTRDALSTREAELRDLVISTMERHTLQELTMPGARDSMRAELAAAVGRLAGPKSGLRVFLPQFVIQ